jgi:hypothetical protein
MAQSDGNPAAERDRDQEQVLTGEEPLVAGWGAIAAGIDRQRLPRHRAGGRRPALALRDQARGRDRVGKLAGRAAARVGAEPLGPSMERGVRGRVLTAQLRPDDLTERVTGVVEPGGALDDRQGVLLARQEIARQDPESGSAAPAPCDPELEHYGSDGETPGRPAPAARRVAAPGSS